MHAILKRKKKLFNCTIMFIKKKFFLTKLNWVDPVLYSPGYVMKGCKRANWVREPNCLLTTLKKKKSSIQKLVNRYIRIELSMF